VVMEVDVIRRVGFIGEDLEPVAAAHVLDVVVGDVVRSVAVDVDAVIFLRGTAGNVVDVIAVPKRIRRIAVDASGKRGVGGRGRAQVVADYAPVVAGNLHGDDARVAAGLHAQIGDRHEMPAGK